MGRISKYTREFKMKIVNEYMNGSSSFVDIATRHNISCSMVNKWVSKYNNGEELRDEELSSLILEYHETYNGILGYRRMTMYINYFNHTNYSWKYIRRLMKKLKIKARIRQKKSNYKKVKPKQIGENVLGRDFVAEHPNQKWLTDVSEFKIEGEKQKLYLSAILDLYDKSIVSYKLSKSNNNILVLIHLI